jgi:polysaccharide deacetylase family protein (PEP-CTERM system associated)
MECIFSVDVEDWFHILDVQSAPDLSQWDLLPSHVEKNFLRLLDIFADHDVTVTCFFLAWVAKKYPHLVRQAANRGHEIASHGYSHTLLYNMTPREFYTDAVVSKDLLENLIGSPVLGYRCSGFSVTHETTWFFDKLINAGYTYDSSVFPAKRQHGGFITKNYAPYVLRRHDKEIVEFPISVKDVLGKPLCFFGGGYLRLFPYFLIRRMSLAVLKEGRPIVFYIHPREIDPKHPRLQMSYKRAFKSYVNLKSTQPKIEHVLTDFKISTVRDFLKKNINNLRIEGINEET